MLVGESVSLDKNWKAIIGTNGFSYGKGVGANKTVSHINHPRREEKHILQQNTQTTCKH